MSEQEKIGRYSYEVEPFQEDYTGRLSWSFLGNHLLKCASFHANTHGFGVIRLNQSEYSWVLSRMVIEMRERPRTGEHYVIETWISNAYRLFTDRCFSIKRDDGRVLGYVYSIWAMINMDTRKPEDLQVLGEDFMACIIPDLSCPIQKPGNIRLKDAELKRIVPTYYSDIDINNHVNSIRYIEHVLDLFPKDWYEKKHVSRIEIAYNEETYCGESLKFYLQQKADTIYAVEVHKVASADARESTVCKCGITFENIEKQ